MGEREVNEAGQAKRFGIDRTLWRMLMLVLFVILAAIGCFLSVAKGAADISLSQIFTICCIRRLRLRIRSSGIYGCPG